MAGSGLTLAAPLLQPALAQPGRLDDATVARIIRVHQDQADDVVLFQNQADRRNDVPGLTPGRSVLRTSPPEAASRRSLSP